MTTFRTAFAGCWLALSVASFAQATQSSADKADTTQKSQSGKDSSATDAKPKTRMVLDHPANQKVPTYTVPAGTEIRVDIVDGKVIVPVRVGFATPIPALSKASVKIDRVYAPEAYDANGNLLSGARYAEYGVLTTITVNGITYKTESDSVALGTPGSSAVSPDNTLGSSPHDVKFVLSAPVEILR